MFCHILPNCKDKGPGHVAQPLDFVGAPGLIRTGGLRIRSPRHGRKPSPCQHWQNTFNQQLMPYCDSRIWLAKAVFGALVLTYFDLLEK